jgi:hypothetical protein
VQQQCFQFEIGKYLILTPNWLAAILVIFVVLLSRLSNSQQNSTLKHVSTASYKSSLIYLTTFSAHSPLHNSRTERASKMANYFVKFIEGRNYAEDKIYG